MTENESQKDQTEALNTLDLSGLQNWDMGPRWCSGDLSKGAILKEKQERTFRKGERTERGSGAQEYRSRPDRRVHTDRRLFQKNKAPATPFLPVARKPFKPQFDVLIYPNDAVFNALSKAMHGSLITYQLFEIANLLLAKPDRFVVVLKPKPSMDSQSQKEPPTKLYASVPDRMPFVTEEEAIQHALKKHLDQFFDISEVEVEAPKGNFQCVCRCSITGIVLGPPNYHKYQQIMQQHHRQNCSQIPFERYHTRIETLKDKASIDEWVESMRKETHYMLKPLEEGQEPKMFDHFEAARMYLINHFKDRVVRQVETVRLEGKDVESLPEGPIKKAIMYVWDFQKRFPLETANNLRGRLRRINFHLYKKGTRGISYACAVKRKFRTPETVFAQSIQDVIDWIEKNPGTKRPEFPFRFLGYELPQADPIPPVPPSVERALNSETADVSTEEVPPEPHEAPSHYTEEQQTHIKQVLLDLRWLISEGYVIEYSDTALHAVPILVQGPGKNAEKPEATEEAVENTEAVEEIKENIETESTQNDSPTLMESVVGPQ